VVSVSIAKKDLESLCDNMWKIGIHRNGAFAEYAKDPERILHKMPKNFNLAGNPHLYRWG